MVHAEYVAALGLSQHPLRIWRDRLEESGDEMDWRSLLHPSARAQLSSAANCSRRKYRLTAEEVDGRSKPAPLQRQAGDGAVNRKAGRCHGVATSLLFRWRVAFGLTVNRRSNFGRRSPGSGVTLQAECHPRPITASC